MMMSRAGSTLPLEMSQRGDSGMKKMRKSWRTDGRPWKRDGMRHDQVLSMRNVPLGVSKPAKDSRCGRASRPRPGERYRSMDMVGVDGRRQVVEKGEKGGI
jgi:hypothetical protein